MQKLTLIKGFTLIELVVTLAILALLSSLAMPSYRRFVMNQNLSNTSSEFLMSLMQARAEALRQGANVAVVPSDGTNWVNGWQVVIVNNNCVAQGSALAVAPKIGDFVVVGTTNTNNAFAHTSPFFAYSPAGFPYQCPGYSGSMNSSLSFLAVEGGRERRVVVSLYGRPRICDPSKETSCT